MKHNFLKAISVSLVLFSLASCGKSAGSEDAVESVKLTDEETVFSYSIGSPILKKDDSELVGIFENYLYPNEKIFLEILSHGGGLEINYDVSASASDGPLEYKLVENIKNMDELNSILHNIYSDSFMDEVISPRFINGGSPLFVEENDKLYYNYNTGGAFPSAPLFDKAEIVEKSKDGYKLSLPMKSLDGEEVFTYEVALDDGFLVLNNSFFIKK